MSKVVDESLKFLTRHDNLAVMEPGMYLWMHGGHPAGMDHQRGEHGLTSAYIGPLESIDQTPHGLALALQSNDVAKANGIAKYFEVSYYTTVDGYMCLQFPDPNRDKGLVVYMHYQICQMKGDQQYGNNGVDIYEKMEILGVNKELVGTIEEQLSTITQALQHASPIDIQLLNELSLGKLLRETLVTFSRHRHPSVINRGQHKTKEPTMSVSSENPLKKYFDATVTSDVAQAQNMPVQGAILNVPDTAPAQRAAPRPSGMARPVTDGPFQSGPT